MHVTRRRVLALGCALLPLAAIAADPAPPLKLVVGEMAPYAMSAGGPGPGALVELTQELGKHMGIPMDVEFYPWSRALATASLKPRTLILPVTRNDERETRYRWLVKLVRQRFVFVGLHGSHDLADTAALKRARLTVLRGTPYKRLLLEAGFTDVSECTTVRECLRMVKKGIADASYGAEDTQRSATHLDGNKENEFDFSPVFQQNEVWLAGSLDFTEEEGRKWRAAMEVLRADGSAARILRKYGISAN
ncbi:transporter substrate-binding domain-containing protein [Duganella sp. CY15W]|uniref:substrate-binding periplasmic protein n=1 Tax=Duganella sp. CY15W TaxID=2692172 RepID=UPI001369DF47|nr:transporter substrate-binding domain-containing protein [Duganella sp. CY15W]MYM30216.1 transporter substrate-binding domain-containing protein [Duganella sp. CY15W]